MSEFPCIVCPIGCHLEVDLQADGKYEVRGAECRQGREYGQREATAPTRVLTTTVATAWGRPLPVRSAAPIDRALLLTTQRRLATVLVGRPVAAGQVVMDDADGQGTALIATATGGPPCP